jgi:hypothetical protein
MSREEGFRLLSPLDSYRLATRETLSCRSSPSWVHSAAPCHKQALAQLIGWGISGEFSASGLPMSNLL